MPTILGRVKLNDAFRSACAAGQIGVSFFLFFLKPLYTCRASYICGLVVLEVLGIMRVVTSVYLSADQAACKVVPKPAPLPALVPGFPAAHPTPVVGGTQGSNEDCLREIKGRIKSANPATAAEALADLRKLILKHGVKMQKAVCLTDTGCLVEVLQRLYQEVSLHDPDSVWVVESACRVVCTMYVVGALDSFVSPLTLLPALPPNLGVNLSCVVEWLWYKWLVAG